MRRNKEFAAVKLIVTEHLRRYQRPCAAAIVAVMARSFHTVILASLMVIAVGGPVPYALAGDGGGRADALTKSCTAPGAWIDATRGEQLASEAVYGELAKRPVLLLGEHHDQAEHHRWQLQTISALHGRGAKLVLGFEMVPRRMQPVLDRWVKGELTKKAFLAAVEWRQIWGFDAELYMPLFDFARMNGIPLVALNVERSLVSRVGAKGWADVPPVEREGVSDPAPASEEYQHSLAEVWAMKQAMKAAPLPGGGKSVPGEHTGSERPKLDTAKLADILANPDFQHFVEAQLVWDRAMAQALSDARRAHPDAVVVGILGSGHIENSYGVPHQLRALGIADAAVLLPVETGESCAKTEAGAADTLFTLKTPAAEEDERPKLGVMIGTKNNAALVNGVMPDSVGAAAGVLKGDAIVRAAGVDIHSAGDLIEVVSRQAWGTWLPLTVQRDGKDLELIAKFGTRPERKP